MKIYLPRDSKQQLGGGFTFYRNFVRGLIGKDVEITSSWNDCDVILITGATMTNRDEMVQAKAAGKKIVFRIDNIPKDSRNRGTAFSRMKDFAQMADRIIFQSEWAKDYVGWWLEDNGIAITDKSDIVYNGVDVELFNDRNAELKKKDRYLYVQFNRDENKRTPEAFYIFHQAHRKNKNSELWIVGQFSPELQQYNFDFFANENVRYLGIIDDQAQMAATMKNCQYLLFPAYADAAPNTVLEAVSCGCEIVGVNDIGGTKEMLALKGRSIEQMAQEYLDVFYKIIK